MTNHYALRDSREFERLATHLRIPRSMWTAPEARYLVDLYHRSQVLQEDFAAQARSESNGKYKSKILAADQTNVRSELSLAERYRQADCMLRALLDILRGAFSLPSDAGYVREKLDTAVRAYGLKVTASAIRAPRARPRARAAA